MGAPRSIHLYKLGSDPEFIFARIVEWQPHIVPANIMITNNKAQGLASFIGCDGHPATAELRPPPAHNVRRHMYDIASALAAIEDFLKKRPSFRDLKMVAQPMASNEPLGGHVHSSIFVNDPLFADIQRRLNCIWTPEKGFVKFNLNRPPLEYTPADKVFMQEAAAACNQGKMFSLYQANVALGYLLGPLENWTQPWPSRVARNNRYGPVSGDPIRWLTTDRPKMDKYDKWGFIHFEYRVPSTWLQHPWLAYAYLAMTKFIWLNWDLIVPVAWKNAREPEKRRKMDQGTVQLIQNHDGMPLPQNEAARQQLYDRMDTLKKAGTLRYSSDVQDLLLSLDMIAKHREQWFTPGVAVNTSAWRSLL